MFIMLQVLTHLVPLPTQLPSREVLLCHPLILETLLRSVACHTSRDTKCLRYRLSSRMYVWKTAWRRQLVPISTVKGSMFITWCNQDTNFPGVGSSCTANYTQWDSLCSGFCPGTQFSESAGKPCVNWSLEKENKLLAQQLQSWMTPWSPGDCGRLICWLVSRTTWHLHFLWPEVNCPA